MCSRVWLSLSSTPKHILCRSIPPTLTYLTESKQHQPFHLYTSSSDFFTMGELHSLLLLLLALACTMASACRVSLECPPSRDCIQGSCQIPGCTSSIECPGGELCTLGTCSPAKYVGEGESCAGLDRCWADLWCDTRTLTCKRYLGIGEGCNSATDRCEPAAVCNLNGVCAYYGIAGPSFGKPCNASEQCVDEGFAQRSVLVCRYGEFTDLISGDRIWYNGGRICARPAPNHFGENCQVDGDSGLLLRCKWGVCLSPLVVTQYAPDRFACQTDADCCSQKCETRASYKNGKRGQVRVCGLKQTNTPALPGCAS
ncbi:hypothetical protein V8F20_011879 [Naviculisporaceae sp. PSN 640]